MTLGMLEILRGGGFTTGGLNFDSKLRRQSTDRTDLFYAHIGGMDTMARALLAAASIVETGELDKVRDERYAGWSGELGSSIMNGSSLSDLHARAMSAGEPTRASGHQEKLENLVARHIERAR
jgi:xylose isomerase